MTKREGAILSAYTGIMLCNWQDYHDYLEELFGRPIFTHEILKLEHEIKRLSEPDFKNIMESLGN